MKAITLHPGSALAGAGVLALVLLGTGVAAPQGGTQRMFIANVLDMNSYPNPRNMIQIRGNEPYTVPTGKIFVLTGLGRTGGSGGAQLLLDGVVEITANGAFELSSGSGDGPGNATSMKLVPPGFIAGEGGVLSILSVGGRAWGYLVDA